MFWLLLKQRKWHRVLFVSFALAFTFLYNTLSFEMAYDWFNLQPRQWLLQGEGAVEEGKTESLG